MTQHKSEPPDPLRRNGDADSREQHGPAVLWWSHGDRTYSRDRIIRTAFRRLGWQVIDFRPVLSVTGNVEAKFRRLPRPDLVWVPCFRQRDAAAAQRWAEFKKVPLVFDPLISAWDKQVFERRKFPRDSYRSQRLLRYEARLFAHSDVLIADTPCHADFFSSVHRVPHGKIGIIPVSAEEACFPPQPLPPPRSRRKVLFYGSFIGLQGPEVIARAAALTPEVDWVLIGTGPLLDASRQIAAHLKHVTFLPRVPYQSLTQHIADADILLGIFGTSEKAGRVIPNKVYQALASARPVITRQSAAWTSVLSKATGNSSGLTFVEAGNPEQLADAVRQLNRDPALSDKAIAAKRTFDQHFSEAAVETALQGVLQRIYSSGRYTAADGRPSKFENRSDASAA